MSERFTLDQLNRIAVLASEGLPANWIAEDIDRKPNSVREKIRNAGIPGHAEELREWNQAWSRIRHRPDLLKLHWEFAPTRLTR